MVTLETMKARHSVRAFNDRKIGTEVADRLRWVIDRCNQEGGLHIQLCLDDPKAFEGFMARVGKFSNVQNYIAMVGKDSEALEERIGYFGEEIVLEATELGLGSCWVAKSYNKGNCSRILHEEEKLVCVIALGYSDHVGVPHKTKPVEKLSRVKGEMPDWFRHGMEAAQLAPTAMNEQRFLISLDGDIVTAKPGFGFDTKVDLGIVKYHFELGADNARWKWAE